MKIPKEVQFVINELKKNGFEAFVVGGCVRDLLRNIEPKDWDVATNAEPEKIRKIFPKSFYNNQFFTVTAQVDNRNPRLKEIEITTYRKEAKYSDKRHPDEVKFAKTIEEDLARRDFTVNAMAIELKLQIPSTKFQINSKSQFPKFENLKIRNSLEIGNWKLEIIDPFKGQKDLKNKVMRAVGKADDRFSEDALRMIRAVRFATTLSSETNEVKGSVSSSPFARSQRAWVVDEANASSSPFARSQRAWVIEEKTAKAIKKNAFWLKAISKERIRDELMKIINSQKAARGIELLRQLELLKHIIPELEEGFGISQNKHHIYDCYEHNLRSLDYAAKKGFNKYVRLAALLHDIAKPHVKQGEGPEATFYNHEIVSAKMAFQILKRLRFSKKDIEKIVKLVRYHLFYYNVGEVSEGSVRRLVLKVGLENMEELLQLRMADRIGSGVPKAEPYKLRHLKYIIEKVSQDPISVKMLKVSGKNVMEIAKIKPGPKVGQILDVLLGYVLSDPKKNKKEFLEKEIKKLGKLSDKELSLLSQKSRKERDKIETKRDEMTKKKYWVT